MYDGIVSKWLVGPWTAGYWVLKKKHLLKKGNTLYIMEYEISDWLIVFS
jgi:hypothetical protein